MFDTSELQDKAKVALSAKQARDPRYTSLVMALSNRLKQPPEQIEQQIIILAMTGMAS